MMMYIRKTQWDPEREGKKGRSRGGKHGWAGAGVKPLCVNKMAAWKPTRNRTVILHAHGCPGRRREPATSSAVCMSAEDRLEFTPYSIALWGNNLTVIATDYSTSSVCLG